MKDGKKIIDAIKKAVEKYDDAKIMMDDVEGIEIPDHIKHAPVYALDVADIIEWITEIEYKEW